MTQSLSSPSASCRELRWSWCGRSTGREAVGPPIVGWASKSSFTGALSIPSSGTGSGGTRCRWTSGTSGPLRRAQDCRKSIQAEAGASTPRASLRSGGVLGADDKVNPDATSGARHLPDLEPPRRLRHRAGFLRYCAADGTAVARTRLRSSGTTMYRERDAQPRHAWNHTGDLHASACRCDHPKQSDHPRMLWHVHSVHTRSGQRLHIRAV